ncbi:MAG TPA: hypothetical protein VFV10_12545 [Gammaproteobacteria bacterium]|nr:hypothetical protein [Gammaproteobacteria bacterium]
MTALPSPIATERTSAAEVAGVDGEGRVFLRLRTGSADVEARILSHVPPECLVPGAQVLVLETADDPARPIVVGIIADRVTFDAARQNVPRTLEVNGRRIHLTGEEEIRLTCGRSTIVLTRDGRIVLRGSRISSRAAETNRIKGGTVQIN